MENNIPIIEKYLKEFQDLLEENPDFKFELFNSAHADPEVFWQLFKEQAIINFLENSDPALTTEQVKNVHKQMFLHSVVNTMEELRKKGFIKGDEISGYELTDVAKQIISNSENSQLL